MPKPFWKFQNVAGGRAELLLYGDISDSTWWGDEVTPKQFAEDLDKLGAVSEITVRINSGGGDVFCRADHRQSARTAPCERGGPHRRAVRQFRDHRGLPL